MHIFLKIPMHVFLPEVKRSVIFMGIQTFKLKWLPMIFMATRKLLSTIKHYPIRRWSGRGKTAHRAA